MSRFIANLRVIIYKVDPNATHLQPLMRDLSPALLLFAPHISAYFSPYPIMSLLAMPVADWSDTCAAIIINNNVSTGLVDQFGNPMPTFTNLTWGITRGTCYQYCGKDKIYQVFDSLHSPPTLEGRSRKSTVEHS
jgi:hypothetical protein